MAVRDASDLVLDQIQLLAVLVAGGELVATGHSSGGKVLWMLIISPPG